MTYKRTVDIRKRKRSYRRTTQQAFSHDVLEIVEDRIFIDGRGADGAPLPAYSTKPLYVSDKDRPKARGGAKTPTGRFYEGGYRQYKQATFNTNKRIPVKTGTLRDSFRVKVARNGSVIVYIAKRGEEHAGYMTDRADWLGLSKADRVAVARSFRALMRKEKK